MKKLFGLYILFLLMVNCDSPTKEGILNVDSSNKIDSVAFWHTPFRNNYYQALDEKKFKSTAYIEFILKEPSYLYLISTTLEKMKKSNASLKCKINDYRLILNLYSKGRIISKLSIGANKKCIELDNSYYSYNSKVMQLVYEAYLYESQHR